MPDYFYLYVPLVVGTVLVTALGYSCYRLGRAHEDLTNYRTNRQQTRRDSWDGELWVLWEDSTEEKITEEKPYHGGRIIYVDPERAISGFLIPGVLAGEIPLIEIRHRKGAGAEEVPFVLKDWERERGKSAGTLVVPSDYHWIGQTPEWLEVWVKYSVTESRGTHSVFYVQPQKRTVVANGSP